MRLIKLASILSLALAGSSIQHVAADAAADAAAGSAADGADAAADADVGGASGDASRDARVPFVFPEDTQVKELTPETYMTDVLHSGAVNLVMFVTSKGECSPCEAGKAELDAMARKLNGIVGVNYVDVGKYPEVSQSYGVKSVPTVYVHDAEIGPQGATLAPYQGERTAKLMEKFALSRLPNHVEQVSSKTIDAFLATEPSQPHGLLLTAKTSTAPLLKSVALEFRHRAPIGEVRAAGEGDNAALMARFGVSELPAFIVVPPSNGEPVQLEGKPTRASIIELVDRFAAPKVAPKFEAPEAPKAVVRLNENNFEKRVLAHRMQWVILYTSKDCGEACTEARAIFEEAADGMREMINFGVVDINKSPQLAKDAKIKPGSLPQVRMYKYGAKKSGMTPVVFKKKQVTLAALKGFATTNLPDEVAILEGQQAVQNFLSTSKQGVDKAMLLSEKSTVSGMYKALAANFAGHVEFVQLTSEDKEVMTMVGNPEKLPQLFFFMPSSVEKEGEATRTSYQLVAYQGELNYQSIARALRSAFTKHDWSDMMGQLVSEVDGRSLIKTVSNQKQWEDYCVKQSKTCIVFMSDDFVDDDEGGDGKVPRRMDLLADVAGQSDAARRDLTFVAIDGGWQYDLAVYLGAADTGYPFACSINTNTNKFSKFIGAFEEDKLLTWIRGISNGRTRLSPLKPGIPEVVDPASFNEDL